MNRKQRLFTLVLLAMLTASVQSQTTSRAFLKAEGMPAGKPERFEFAIGGDKYKITSNGRGSVKTANGNSEFFNLRLADELLTGSRLYYAQHDGDLLILSDVGDIEYASGFIARLDLKSMKLRWKASLPGFNVGPGLIDNKHVYVTAIGFIGKLNLDSGKYIWRHRDLYRNKTGSFNSFEVPELRAKTVVFKESQVYSWKKVAQITVDGATGRILEIDA